MEHINLYSGFKRATQLLMCFGLLVGCAAPVLYPMATGQNVSIIFDENLCPRKTNPDIPIEISKKKGDQVKWQAVDQQGINITSTTVPGFSFAIYFDPFVGPHMRSGKGGWIRSLPVNMATPTNVEFKYTIVGSTCPGSPLDPRIKIL